MLAEKNTDGDVTARRLKVEKLRQAPTGRVFPFELVDVPIGPKATAGAVRWKDERHAGASRPSNPSWTGAGRVLKAAIERALIDHGVDTQPFGSDGPRLKCCPVEKARGEFNLSYTADTSDAKRKAFRREMDRALGKGQIAVRELSGTDWLWLVTQDRPDT